MPRKLSVGGMSSRNKSAASAKKVAPPTVPDGGNSSSSSTSSSSSSSSTCSSHRHSGSSLSSGVFSAGDQRSSYSSSLGDAESNPPPSPRSPGREPDCDPSVSSTSSSSSSVSNRIAVSNGNTGNASPSHYQSTQQQQFTFPQGHQTNQFSHLMCPKISPGSPHHLSSEGTYAYLTYQQQTSLEDQGIDVQSPGRSSPGSGSGSSTTGSTASSSNCRNSTTSLDSGRASSSTLTHTHRLSGHSYDSNSIRHSYHSSSSSLGSMEQDGTTHVNVHELIKNGVPDAEVLRAWLCDLHFEEYYDKFISAGYDMPTISRMTPEDLNAIGITKPAHRKKLKTEITRLNISDGLPDFISSRLEEWLSLLRLEEYTSCLKQQNYNTVHQMTQITWEDLEDVGISKLGHQKKVMLAIKRAKDIMSGKKFSQDGKQTPVIQYPPQEIIIARDTSENRENYMNLVDLRTFNASNQYGHDQGNRFNGPDPGGQHGVHTSHYTSHPMPFPHPNHSGQYLPLHPSQYRYPGGHPPTAPNTIHYRPDVVAVQVRPNTGKSENAIYGTYHTFLPEQRLPPQGPLSLGPLNQRQIHPSQLGSHPQRSLDDGDITPTNEVAGGYEGGATLPRPRNANKYRPVAKVTAKTRADIHAVPLFAKDTTTETNLKAIVPTPAQHIKPQHGSASTSNTPQGTPKKLPPPPPKRSNSISESTKDSNRDSQYGYLRRGLSYGYMGVKSNLQPEVTPNLPPPPPAPQDRGNHQHLQDFPPPPPPLTCITMANTARTVSINPSINSNSGSTDPHITQSPHHHSLSSDSESEVGFRNRRNESNSSFKSTSSNDSSESLPFANDNAGTIKQRITRPHTGFLMDTRSPRGSPLSSPALRRKEGIVLPNLRQPPPPTNGNVIINNNIPEKNHTNTATIPSSAIDTSSPEETKDVLNDIGNMLASLTDELDAMLEQDLTVKN